MSDRAHALALLLRPEESSQRLARFLEGKGIPTKIAPIMEIVHHPLEGNPVITPSDQILLTSAHAVPSLCHWPIPEEIKSLVPVYTSGPQTALAARAAGFSHIVASTGGVEELLPSLTKHKGGCLYYLRGEDVALDVAAVLHRAGVRVIEKTVYHARSVNRLPDSVRMVMEGGHPVMIPFYSARTAKIFLDLLEQESLLYRLKEMESLSISARVLECTRPSLWKNAHMTGGPSDGNSMREALLKLCRL